ncbi:MAG: hypothetical protein ACLP1X_16320 [Polyangiaceae bacterium]
MKLGDCTCPFCGNEVPHVDAPALVAVGRLSRASLFVASAAGLALLTTDCGSNPQPLPPYGAPCCEVPTPDAAPEDASTDAADSGSSTPGH